MRLLLPGMLGFLGLIPLIVLMYLLKQKHEERIISSSLLWEQVLKDIEVNTPWQRLRRNLLLLLQILVVLLCVLALTQPNVSGAGGNAAHLIFVFDRTGSMNAAYQGGESRLETAKREAEEFIRNSKRGTTFTVITSGAQTHAELTEGGDQGNAIAVVKGIQKSEEFGDISNSLSVIRALQNKTAGSYAVIYTDHRMELSGIDGTVVSLAEKQPNVSLDYAAHSREEGRLTVLIRLSNRSEDRAIGDLSLYHNNEILDLKTLELKPGETKTIYFEGLSSDLSSVRAEWSTKDALPDDNVIYHVIGESRGTKIYLLSDKNVFLEKALSILPDTELYKGSAKNPEQTGYDLYVYDGVVPAEYPKDGGLLLIGQTRAGEVEGGTITVIPHPLTKYVDTLEAVVSHLGIQSRPAWADDLMTVNGRSAIYAGNHGGQRTAVFNFNLHESDFVLTPEFPIFMTNLSAWLTGREGTMKTSYLAGETLDVNKPISAEDFSVTAPKAGQTGFYTTSWRMDGVEVKKQFAVNFPSEQESNLLETAENQENVITGKTARGALNLQLPLVLLTILAICAEWVVYIRGY